MKRIWDPKRLMRRKSTIATRWHKLFVPMDGDDAWLKVDARILDELCRNLPGLPDGWKVRSLDFSCMPDLRALPSGICCDQLDLSGTSIHALPSRLSVTTALTLRECKRLGELPRGLTVQRLDVGGCTRLMRIPGDLRVERLDLSGCTALVALPATLRCSHLELDGTRLRHLPNDLRVSAWLSLRDCRRLESLPTGLTVSILNIVGCTGLGSLPAGLNVYDLNMAGCTALADWPDWTCIHRGRIMAAGCRSLVRLPRWLNDLEVLDIHDCTSLRELPSDLRVRDWIDIGNTAIRSLPESLRGTTVRWRGVEADADLMFHPERIRPEHILGEANVERRRLYLERFGMERFMETAGARVLDTDDDTGGPRRLLTIDWRDDEPLVCVAVRCPSTGRQYMLRVPPTVRTCHEAVAWTAGFDDPEQYTPRVET